MNYIEKFMQDKGLKCMERFKVNERIVYFDNFFSLRTDDEKLEGIIFMGLLQGNCKIEKIKPKTLMEKLKEQGEGYALHADGTITLRHYEDLDYFGYLTNNNAFLTKSEAKKEAYRRQLEFEMNEWPRENKCLADCFGEMVFQGFNVYIHLNKYTKDNLRVVRNIFSDKVDKYYNWEE